MAPRAAPDTPNGLVATEVYGWRTTIMSYIKVGSWFIYRLRNTPRTRLLLHCTTAAAVFITNARELSITRVYAVKQEQCSVLERGSPIPWCLF